MLRPGQSLDQFQVLSSLGHGTYAGTWLARDVETLELVVLKLPDEAAKADPETRARFQLEATIVRLLKHPGIQSAAASLPPRSDYLALEYVEGATLREWLHEHGTASAVQTVAIGVQVASALAYSHSHGVVHRDLKPENVILLYDGSVKLIDFGSASLEGARPIGFSYRREIAGTPDYISPEQVDGYSGDPRTDIYSLGVVLYELCTGEVPFGGDNASAVMYQHVHSDPVPPRTFHSEIPSALETVILKCLRKRPEERYQDAMELEADLARRDRDPAASTAYHKHPVARWWARLTMHLRQRRRL